ncbi:MAG: T9SS type A sorting domain-containing protein [Nonlabens sp.]
MSLLALFMTVAGMQAQTLSAGDVVVISAQTDTPDAFRIVPLVDLPAGTVINITENGVNGGTLNTNEGTVTYTAPTVIAAGTNILFDSSSSMNPDFTITGSLGYSTGGDQFIVYQESGMPATTTFIFAAQTNSTVWQTAPNDTNQSELPPGLTDGTNAVALGSGPGGEDENDNSYYTGITSGTKAELLAAVSSAANWTPSGSADATVGTTTDFVIQTPTTDPSITITSPGNGALSATNNVDVQFSVSNFDFSTDGDLLITILNNNTSTSTTIIKTDDTTENIAVDEGVSYTVTAQLRDTMGADLTNAEASSSVTFNVEFSCTLDLDFGTIVTSCDASTSGTDTYTSEIQFTGGNNGGNESYNLSISGGTLAGDDPNFTQSGTIVILNAAEGTDTTLSITGAVESSCDLSVTFNSPTCLPLPIEETFDYTAGTLLGAQPNWESFNSGDEIEVVSGNLNFPGQPSGTGEKVVMNDSGAEAILSFSDQTSGIVYASFIMDVTTINADGNNYFAAVASGRTGYESRLFVDTDNATQTYTFGIQAGSSSADRTTDATTYPQMGFPTTFVVVAYDLDNLTASLWANPLPATFGAPVAPPPTITSTEAMGPTAINGFTFRQSGGLPTIEVDGLRIADNWAAVTAATFASNADSSIAGFQLYPNPVVDGQLNIATTDSTQKEVVVYDLLGKQVIANSYESNLERMDVSTLTSGIYVVKVIDGANTVTRKLIVR